MIANNYGIATTNFGMSARTIGTCNLCIGQAAKRYESINWLTEMIASKHGVRARTFERSMGMDRSVSFNV